MLFVGLQMCFMPAGLYAQDTTISGSVSDNTGAPVVGATVYVKGTSAAGIADAEGLFRFQATVPADGVLVAAFIGMETREVPMGGRTSFEIVLQQSNTLIEEVQVVAYPALGFQPD